MTRLATVLRIHRKTSIDYKNGLTWTLYFNVTKCNVTHIGKKNEEADYKMKVNEDEYRSTAKCNEEKDLGIIFDTNFSFDVPIQSCINKANKMIGIIKRTFTFLNIKKFSIISTNLQSPSSTSFRQLRVR